MLLVAGDGQLQYPRVAGVHVQQGTRRVVQCNDVSLGILG